MRFETKNHTDVLLPDMVSDDNSSMEGVDLADMFIALYRTEITTKKRRYLKRIFYMVDVWKINGWLLSRRFCDQQQRPKKTQKELLTYITDMIQMFQLSGKSKSVGRPSKRFLSPQPAVGKKSVVVEPVCDVRFDVVDHFF